MTYIDPTILFPLQGDPGRLRQILLNLIDNAVKFTTYGEIIVRADLISNDSTQILVRFIVRDTGSGLSEIAQQRLFQPFTQVDGTTTRKHGGIGLGLIISKRLIELMGGEIGVESTEGQGTTFWFTARFERSFAFDSEESSFTKANLPQARLLVVANNPANCEIISTYVNSWGLRSENATSGATALDRLRAAAVNDPYALAIIDMTLSDMDGFTLAHRIQQEPTLATTQLILLTEFDHHEHGHHALQAGFKAHLSKPVKQSHLFGAITGLSFGINLPARVDDQSHLPTTYPKEALWHKQSDIPTPSQKQAILLAEDNLANRKLATYQLEKLGYTVHAVTNGHAAVEAIKRNPLSYSLILMDCYMPEMDGFTATQTIRKLELTRRQHIPIIAMTANALHGNRDACLASGMDDYITKPVHLETLRIVIEHWLNPELPLSGIPTAPVIPKDNPMSNLLDMNIIMGLRTLQGSSNQDLMSELIEVYFTESQNTIQHLRTAVEQGNGAEIFHTAHSLKGNSASLGAMNLAALCKEMEHKGHIGDITGTHELLIKIETEYEQVQIALEAERQHSKTSIDI